MRRPHATPSIAERIQRWKRTGDPRHLWPGVEADAFHAARDAIGRATRAMLREPEPGGRVELESPVGSRAMGVAAFATGMGPLLGYWIERGRLVTADDVAPVLAEQLTHCRRRNQMLDEKLGWLLDAFEARRIEPIVLKGMHTAWEYFPEPGVRPMADIDLLVPRSRLHKGIDVMRDLGFEVDDATQLQRRSSWRLRGTPDLPGTLELERVDNPWAVDLHASLERQPRFGRPVDLGVPPAAMTMARGNRVASVLPQPHLLAFLTLHATQSLPYGRLLAFVELVLVIRRDFPLKKRPWDDLETLVAHQRLHRFVYTGLTLAADLAPGAVPTDLLDRLAEHTSRRLRRTLSRLSPENAQQLYRRSVEVRLMWMDGPLGLASDTTHVLRRRGVVGFMRRVLARVLRWSLMLVRRGLSIRAH